MAKEVPYRGQSDDSEQSTPLLARAVTIEEYRKNISKRMLSEATADRFRWECMQQPNWRRDAQLDEDYYDGHQFTSEILCDLEDRGIPPIVTNLIGPTIDVVLGMEAKTRRDFVVKPEDDPQWDQVATAMSSKLKTAERLSQTDHACSEAYKRQIKGGLGWAMVRRQTDPYRYRYITEHIDWREIDYDPYSEKADMTDGRFLRRSKFYDRDVLEATFPKMAPQIHELGPGFRTGGSSWTDTRELFEAPMLRGASHGPWRDFSQTELNYFDWDRGRLLLEEWWYRVWVRGRVLDMPDGTTIVFDERNEAHAYALESRRAAMRYAAWPEMRFAYHIGPLCLSDAPSPHPFRDFPYVPFWGMREGRTLSPYGLIRRMRPMQDEVNARSSKMLWALSARRVIADPGALLDHEATRLEVARPDAYILLNPKRLPTDRFEVEDNQGIAKQQFDVLQDRIQRLQDVGGVYQAMLGKEGAADSGIAIANLVEQGTTTLAPINENFVFARSQVGERLLAFVIADMKPMRDVPVQVNSARGKRVITLNQSVVHEQTGIEYIENNVAKARLKVTLDDMPATATFRQQQFTRIADMLTKMATFNPELASKFMDLLIEASDVPNKQEFVDRVREMIGLTKDPSTMTPEERQQHEAQQQEQQQQKQLAMRGAVAKIATDESKAAQLQAQTQKTAADTEAVHIGFDKIIAEIGKLHAEIAGMKQDQVAQDAALAANGGKPDKQQVVYRW